MNDNGDNTTDAEQPAETFVEGIDFYFEDGLMVLTRRYLLGRGVCCESGCRHCPFGDSNTI